MRGTRSAPDYRCMPVTGSRRLRVFSIKDSPYETPPLADFRRRNLATATCSQSDAGAWMNMERVCTQVRRRRRYLGTIDAMEIDTEPGKGPALLFCGGGDDIVAHQQLDLVWRERRPGQKLENRRLKLSDGERDRNEEASAPNGGEHNFHQLL